MSSGDRWLPASGKWEDMHHQPQYEHRVLSRVLHPHLLFTTTSTTKCSAATPPPHTPTDGEHKTEFPFVPGHLCEPGSDATLRHPEPDTLRGSAHFQCAGYVKETANANKISTDICLKSIHSKDDILAGATENIIRNASESIADKLENTVRTHKVKGKDLGFKANEPSRFSAPCGDCTDGSCNSKCKREAVYDCGSRPSSAPSIINSGKPPTSQDKRVLHRTPRWLPQRLFHRSHGTATSSDPLPSDYYAKKNTKEYPSPTTDQNSPTLDSHYPITDHRCHTVTHSPTSYHPNHVKESFDPIMECQGLTTNNYRPTTGTHCSSTDSHNSTTDCHSPVTECQNAYSNCKSDIHGKEIRSSSSGSSSYGYFSSCSSNEVGDWSSEVSNGSSRVSYSCSSARSSSIYSNDNEDVFTVDGRGSNSSYVSDHSGRYIDLDEESGCPVLLRYKWSIYNLGISDSSPSLGETKHKQIGKISTILKHTSVMDLGSRNKETLFRSNSSASSLTLQRSRAKINLRGTFSFKKSVSLSPPVTRRSLEALPRLIQKDVVNSTSESNLSQYAHAQCTTPGNHTPNSKTLPPASSSPSKPPHFPHLAGRRHGVPTLLCALVTSSSPSGLGLSFDTVSAALKHDQHFVRKAINSEVEIQCENGERRVLRSTCDWNEGAINGDHLWCPTSASGDFCYVGEDFCCKSGARMKCSACKIIAHTGCIAALVERVKFPCKPTFRDVGPRQYREQTATHHHWVHRRSQKGKCKQCGKGFQSKLLFGSKEIVAISCSWCKSAYHNKESCFNISKIEETCSLGLHASIIVPPSWIVKLPRRGSFKSSLRKSPKKRASTKRKSRDKQNDKETRPFAIKPIPNANIKPLIVFINPKSGGNQGAKLMQKFQWLLNPRQVFDLTQGGPKAGLEMFRKVTNLRVLACGGDGTVGWVLSVLDQLNFQPPPAVAVLPLGTGNDLARALGWGGGYTDEPISKILCNIADGEVVHLDRWRVDVVKNEDYEPTEEGRDTLPLSVVNNYFSFGVDAHIALEFHEAREANPQKFNSRLRNKMFYGQAGGKDLLQRKWKDLSDNCTLECDGKDMTPLLKEYKVHAVVFLNIPSYGSGTHPWNRSGGVEQHTDDGIIEVIGLTTYQMPLLQAGGHGTTICQCKRARIITKKTIPMQVDGEAARVNPSIIELTHLNTASMVTKKKAKSITMPHLEQLRLQVSRITMFDYEQHHYDKEKLRSASSPIGLIMIDQDADLEQVRKHINRMMEETAQKGRSARPLSESWCFLDSCTAERFFRIDRAQEHLHYVTDICTEDLFVLDPELIDPTSIVSGGVRGDVSVDNDIDHSERMAMVSDSDSGVGGTDAEQRNPTSALTASQDSSDTGEEEALEARVPSLHERVFGPEYYPPSHLLEKNSDGIIKAAKQGDLKMLKDLHSQGYSLLSIDGHGQTALHFGARHGYKDIVRYLIASAPPSILDMVDTEKGQTALHQAAHNRRRTVCCMLVAAGASLTIRDLQGNTPRALAQRADDQELAAYLESQEQFQTMVHEDLETTV